MDAVTPDPIRVVIADDHPIWRSGVRADLGENFIVVAEAGDAATANSAVRRRPFRGSNQLARCSHASSDCRKWSASRDR